MTETTITIPSIIITLIIAGLCGAVAQLIVGYTRGGFLAALLIGFIGALLGSYIAALLRMPNILVVGGVDVVWTIIGAALFVALLSLNMGGRRFGGYRGYRRRYY